MKVIIVNLICKLAEIYLSIKWCPWNPWCVSRLNLALKKYMETVMYKERVKAFGHEWAIESFENNSEVKFFVHRFTTKDTLRMVFTPFSCGDHYSLPWWQIQEWWYGGEDEV